MTASRSVLIALLTWALGACSTTPAPVIDRLPNKSSTAKAATPASKQSAKTSGSKINGDWRPDTHTVKKGDTLFSIGLEYGYDYKEIAQINDISAPYIIRIGQVLKLGNLQDKTASNDNKVAQENADGVITYPINNDSAVTVSSTPATPRVVALSEPKAIREPYSDEALKKPLPAATKAEEVKTVASKPATAATTTKPDTAQADAKIEPKADSKAEPKSDSKTNSDVADNLGWAWPTKGKVIASFNDAGNKGIDIAGSMGQAIVATAPGKVIYSGSDLRGYGKLVIIKHNATYLSVYAHNSQILVKEGQQVSRGQKIAEMGNTDSSTVKLHFEIRQQGKSVDPAKFLASN